MRAKDTVMNRKQASKVIDGLPPNELFGYMIGDRQPWKFIAKAQAKLTWQRISEEIEKGLLTTELHQIALNVFGSRDGIRLEFPSTFTGGELIQEAMKKVAQAQLQKVLALLK